MEEVVCYRRDISYPRPVVATRTTYTIYRAQGKIKICNTPLFRDY